QTVNNSEQHPSGFEQRPGAPVLQTIGDRMPAVEKGIDNTQTADKVPVELRILRMDEGCVADTNPVLKEEPFVIVFPSTLARQICRRTYLLAHLDKALVSIDGPDAERRGGDDRSAKVEVSGHCDDEATTELG